MNNKKRGWFSKRTWSNIIVICVGVMLFLALSNLNEVLKVLGGIWAVFSPFLGGVVIAFLLNMPMRFFERTLFKKRPAKSRRVLAICATYFSAFLVVALLIGLITPQIVESIGTLLDNANIYLANLNGMVTNIGTFFHIDQEIIDTFLISYKSVIDVVLNFFADADALANVLDIASRIGSGLVGGLVSFFTSLIASIYMLAGRDKLLVQCRRILYAISPKRLADGVVRVGQLSSRIFSNFISGKILDSAIIGAICFVGLSIMNIISRIFGIEGLYIQFSVLISVVVGVTNIIPFFGPFIGAIPCILILLMVNPWSAVWFTAFIIVLQQFDGNLIGPKILGSSTGLPAMWVLVAIMVGGGLFGFMGMLLGVPTAAVLYTLGSELIERRLQKKGLAQQEELSRSMLQKAERDDVAVVDGKRPGETEAPPPDSTTGGEARGKGSKKGKK